MKRTAMAFAAGFGTAAAVFAAITAFAQPARSDAQKVAQLQANQAVLATVLRQHADALDKIAGHNVAMRVRVRDGIVESY